MRMMFSFGRAYVQEINPSTFTIEQHSQICVCKFCNHRLGADEATQRTWDDLLTTIRGLDVNHVVLDLSNVVFLSSTSLGKLISLQVKLRQRNAKLTLCGLSDDIAGVFQVSRLNQVLDCRKTVDEILITG